MVSKRSPRPALSCARSKQIGGARERGAEAAVGRLEHVDDPGEAAAGEQRPIEPALGRAAGMHALDHGAVLRRHQAGRLGAGDAERMHGLLRRRGRARAPRRPRPRTRRRSRPNASPGRYAPGPCTCPRAARSRSRRPRRVRKSRPESRAWLSPTAIRAGNTTAPTCNTPWRMHVVELEALHLRAVDQGRVRRGEAQCRAPHRGGAGRIELAERAPAGSCTRAGRRRRCRSRSHPGSTA